ncbi:phage head closure protein [Faunimonas sp. B44]|uniref:phage head closure protein n=1 Tax=Faunimonas sp. B44 TaxID=3461493 RepID=UPI00404424A0
MTPSAPPAGRLRHRLALEKADRVPDGAGGTTLAWSETARFFAEVAPLRAEERAEGEGLSDRVTHKVTVRHRADVAAGDRLRLGARTLVIRSVHDPHEDRRFLVCMATEEGSAS